MKVTSKDSPYIFEGSVEEYFQIKDSLYPIYIDINKIPDVLGVDLPERLSNWISYRKDGLIIIDNSKENV